MQMCFLLLFLIQLHVTEGITRTASLSTPEIPTTSPYSRPDVNTTVIYKEVPVHPSTISDPGVTTPVHYTETIVHLETTSYTEAPLRSSPSTPEITRNSPQPREALTTPVHYTETIVHLETTSYTGCSLKGNGKTEFITTYTGDSVLLPCSCTELHSKPENFTWKKYTNNWAQISPESDEYKERFQLVNDHSSGNFSLLISHLIEQDGGGYWCGVKGGEFKYVSLTVKGCRLKGNRWIDITAYTGDSVLLPCSCTELHRKPETFTWERSTDGNNWTQISPESDEYKERFQLVNDHSSGNLSLLISHLTEQDGGFYRCDVKGSEFRYVSLTVKGCSLKGNRWIEITAYTGDSVLLPCSCTELHRKPETFTWERSTDGNNFAQISPESDEYKERFQLVNDHSSGNLSLLISHLTEQDGGLYMCDVKWDENRFISLTVKGCRLKGNREIEQITAYTGDSVLLPCSCTELHRKPETFTWKKTTDGNNWAQISPERDEYKERFQLVNDHSSGNLSLLISHLTEQDGGDYRCDAKGGEYRDISLSVKACRLNQQTVDVTGIVGQSVLLPCSCSELQGKPQTFKWGFYKGSDVIKIFPKQQTNLYTNRVQVFNDHPPGNLSLLISHLTVEDGGLYRCEIDEMTTYIYLTVKGCNLKGNGETEEITAYTGDPVLLPCSCTELHRKPETFTWKKTTDGNNWAQISTESDEYKGRFQLVNDQSSGNLSLLISHLTEQDGGDYRCDVSGGEYRYVRLTVKGCSLKGNRETEEITAYTGDSVLLPCSCTELHSKPETFTWKKNTDRNNWTQISPESDEYKERFQLVNDHSSGNLSLLISHLTEQDGGVYRCTVKGDEYRYISLTVKDCRLKGNEETEQITAYTGDSVLLPCSCTELHSKPETFTWKKSTDGNKWTQISPESDEYKERFQLVNDHSSGNLSLLISHLTEQDGGFYRCDVNGNEYRYISLTVKGCRLNQQTVNVTGIVGQSVLLPCSCSELQAKPHTFRWSFNKGPDVIKIFPKVQTNRYTDRVHVFNDHPPGNLSLLISHLTVEDGGLYRCEINNKITTDIKLTVKAAPTRPSSSTPVITTTSPYSRPGYTLESKNLPPVLNDETTVHTDTSEKGAPTRPSSSTPEIKTTSPHSRPGDTLEGTKPAPVLSDVTTVHTDTSETDSLPYIPVAIVTVIFLHIIVAVVYCTPRKKGSAKVHYSRGDEDGTVSLQ
ncbi:obscurin-like [Tachysurus fulvidraco]|uniref:obscurin-like n=1 Tax=Tachysurus fulvidraco TaxID=1234273 RepID=UPI001FED9493|nr:obscurin-like [Tachysurus fulvidraco]